MTPAEVRMVLISLLSACRRDDDPRYCQSLTKRQICSHIEELLPPCQRSERIERLFERIGEQLEMLVQDFELIRIGDSRLRYCMAPPSLIVSREEPLLAQFKGDRAYFSLTKNLIQGQYNDEDRLIGSQMRIIQARSVLEQIGVSVQTEDMLFQAVPDPTIPTKNDLSKAEQIDQDLINRSFIDVYVPKRGDFFASRWMRNDRVTPSSSSELHRIRFSTSIHKSDRWAFLWHKNGVYYRLTSRQALLSMYRIDWDRNAARLLSLDEDIPFELTMSLPIDYARLVLRYTVVSEERNQSASDRGDGSFNSRRLRIRPKYKDLIRTLMEDKLGLNRPMI